MPTLRNNNGAGFVIPPRLSRRFPNSSLGSFRHPLSYQSHPAGKGKTRFVFGELYQLTELVPWEPIKPESFG